MKEFEQLWCNILSYVLGVPIGKGQTGCRRSGLFLKKFSFRTDPAKAVIGERALIIMQESIIDFINQYGYFGIAFLIWLETIFPPIPSEVILIFSGYLITQTAMILPWAILSATIGSMAGAAVLYVLGWYLGKSKLHNLLSGVWGKRLHFNQMDLEKTERWFARYQGRAVLICRFVPIVRSLISIPAGITRMQPMRFFSLTLLGSLGWNAILILLGQSAGSAWQNGLAYIGWYSKIILATAAIVAIYLLYRSYRKKRK